MKHRPTPRKHKASAGTQPAIRKDILFIAAAVLIGLGSFLLYAPTLDHGFIEYDDPDYVIINPNTNHGLSWQGVVWSFTASHAANWHPLTWLSHMLDSELFGLNPAGHHLTSILFHAANSILVLVLLKRMTGSLWRSLAVAAFFAWHPLRVESVAWVSERKDVLSGFFFLLTLLAYHAYTLKRVRERPALALVDGRYLLSLFFFACGLMSKPMLVTLPFILLLLDYWPLERISWPSNEWRSRLRWLCLEKIPFFLLTALSCLVTFLSQHTAGATQMIGNLGLWPRIQNASISYCRYIGKTLWSTDLSVFYPFPPEWWHPGMVAASAVALTTATLLAVAVARRHRFVPVGWFWYLGTLVPVVGILQVGEQSIADRYTYLPSIGLLILMVWGAAHLVAHLRFPTWTTMLGTLALAAPCVALTVHQVSYWKDGETLFRHAKAVTPPYYNTRLCLGISLRVAQKYDAALLELNESLALYEQSALAHYNKGAALEGLGRIDEALQSYEKAVQLAPQLKLAHLAMARIHFSAQHFEPAILCFKSVLQFEPEDAGTRFLLGLALKASGRREESLAQMKRTILEDPALAAAHSEAAILLAEAGKLSEAVPYFKDAARLDPGNENYLFNLNQALEQSRRHPAPTLPNQ